MYPLVGSISVESQIRSQLEVKSRDPLWAQTGLEVGKLVAGYRVVRPLTDRALGASALVCHEKTGRALELKLLPAGLGMTCMPTPLTGGAIESIARWITFCGIGEGTTRRQPRPASSRTDQPNSFSRRFASCSLRKGPTGLLGD